MKMLPLFKGKSTTLSSHKLPDFLRTGIPLYDPTVDTYRKSVMEFVDRNKRGIEREEGRQEEFEEYTSHLPSSTFGDLWSWYHNHWSLERAYALIERTFSIGSSVGERDNGVGINIDSYSCMVRENMSIEDGWHTVNLSMSILTRANSPSNGTRSSKDLRSSSCFYRLTNTTAKRRKRAKVVRMIVEGERKRIMNKTQTTIFHFLLFRIELLEIRHLSIWKRLDWFDQSMKSWRCVLQNVADIGCVIPSLSYKTGLKIRLDLKRVVLSFFAGFCGF